MARGKRPVSGNGSFRFSRKKSQAVARSPGAQALRMIKALNREREVMYNDEEVTIGTLQGTVQPIARVSGDSDAGQRNGDKITLKSLYVRATVVKPQINEVGTSALSVGDVFHLAIVLQKLVSDSTEVPSYDEVFIGTPIQGPLFNTKVRGEYRILAQEKFIVDPQTSYIDTSGQDNFHADFQTKMVDWYPKVKGLAQWYQGTANNTGYKTRLWLFARSQRIGTDGTEGGTTQAHCIVRLGYTDTS